MLDKHMEARVKAVKGTERDIKAERHKFHFLVSLRLLLPPHLTQLSPRLLDDYPDAGRITMNWIVDYWPRSERAQNPSRREEYLSQLKDPLSHFPHHGRVLAPNKNDQSGTLRISCMAASESYRWLGKKDSSEKKRRKKRNSRELRKVASSTCSHTIQFLNHVIEDSISM